MGYPSNVENPWETLNDRVKEAFKRIRGDEKGALSSRAQQEICAWQEETIVPELFDDLDQLILWVGQHGSSNIPLPMTGKDYPKLTKPQDTFIIYASYLFQGLNRFVGKDPSNRDAIWLCPDPRNYLKLRDIKYPLKHPVIAQYELSRPLSHESFGDRTTPQYDINIPPGNWSQKTPSVYDTKQSYTYDALELTALPSPAKIPMSASFGPRYDFGMLVNENRAYVKNDRKTIIKDWVLPFWPRAEIFGTWSDESKEELNRPDIKAAPYEHVGTVLQRWRCTLTTPASGSGWATAKPWECFAYGVVCFFHPAYDDQDNILKDAPIWLRDWLRVSSPQELRQRVDAMCDPANEDKWRKVIDAQRAYFEVKYTEWQGGVKSIMERLDG